MKPRRARSPICGARAGAGAAQLSGRARPAARGGEIDLILRERDGTLVFVEVRARADARHGGAAASVGVAKQRSLVFAAQHFLRRLAARRRAASTSSRSRRAHRVAARRLRRRVKRVRLEPTPQTRVISSVTMLEQRIQQQFFDSADLKYAAAEVLSKPIADAVSALVGCITGGGKVLACGNGGSAADAQHFAAEFVGRFERERPGLAAIALTVDTSILTAVGNDYGYEVIFSKQVAALGSPGDVLLAMSTSGNPPTCSPRSTRRTPRR